jgi:excisionase family DNA binding protein
MHDRELTLAAFLGDGRTVGDYLLADRRRHDFIGRHLPFTLIADRIAEPVRYELGDDWLDLMVLYDPGLGWEVHVLGRSCEDIGLPDVETDLKDRLRLSLAVHQPTGPTPVTCAVIGEILNRLERLENSAPQPSAAGVVESPYLTADEAAAYLRTNVNALYSLVERRKLAPLPGHRKYRFTRDMLDNFLRGN